MPDRLMLLDTASLYFRAFYGVPDTVRAPDGTPVNAARGLLDMIAKLVAGAQDTSSLVTVLTATVTDAQGYGRIDRDGPPQAQGTHT